MIIKDGNIQLISAILKNDLDSVTILLTNKNIDLNYKYTSNIKDIYSDTPLILAVKYQRLDIVKLLLGESPDKLDRNIPDRWGNSPIILAVLSGNLKYEGGINYHILKLLLEDPYVDKGYIKKENNSDPMTCALWVEDLTITEILIDYNVPVYWEHLDELRKNYYTQLVNNYYCPYEPKGTGYLNLLKKYTTV